MFLACIGCFCHSGALARCEHALTWPYLMHCIVFMYHHRSTHVKATLKAERHEHHLARVQHRRRCFQRLLREKKEPERGGMVEVVNRNNKVTGGCCKRTHHSLWCRCPDPPQRTGPRAPAQVVCMIAALPGLEVSFWNP